ncbi:MAG: BrnT family toxin [Chthoniobacteraceae bacterium]|nr:BrnT family toxin [Chthoniobacteraceae bacterium]NBV34216.1 BrnT family toxin [Pseudomonadota bacterium]
MDFEFDPDKSAGNREKHGIDFLEAQEVWNDLFALEVQAKSETEKRFALLGTLKDKVWAVFFTERNGRIRIISARRARINEEALYYESRTT